MREIIDRWAPDFENDTDSYTRAVASAMGIGLDVEHAVNVHDYATMRTLVRAIIRHENGSAAAFDWHDDTEWYDAVTLDAGLRLAGIVAPRPRALPTPMALIATTGGLAQAGFAGYDWLTQRIRDEVGVDVGGSSGLQRYGSKLQRRLGAIKASTEAARMIAEAAPDEADDRSNAIISMVQTEIFDALLAMQEMEEETNPAKKVEVLGKAAKNIATLTRASVTRNKWASEVQGRIDKAKADIKQIAAGAGISEETMAAIDARLQGIRVTGNARIIPANPKGIFLPGQTRWINDRSRLKLGEKSRQVGWTWTSAYT
ncbi:phage protein Gp27 family protein [Rhodanobacter lindaniclasticus]